MGNCSSSSSRGHSAPSSAAQVVRADWAEAVAALNVPASMECLEYLRREVESGISRLWRASDGVDTLWVISRVDRNPSEVVFPLVVGSGLKKFAPLFIAKAREAGLPIRIHTECPKVMRLCRRIGFRLAEYVMRMPQA